MADFPLKNQTHITNDLISKAKAVDYAVKVTRAFNEFKLQYFDRMEKLEASLNISIETNKNLASEVARLKNRVIQLERESTNNNQCSRRRQIELWNLPEKITDSNQATLKTEAASILSLAGVPVKGEDIDVVHKLKTGQIIIEFGRRDLQTNILKGRKNLKNEKVELGKRECPKLSVVESMCHEYKRLDYACRMLVKSNNLEKTFFFNRKLHVVKNREHQLIAHLVDLYDMFGPEKIDKLFDRK